MSIKITKPIVSADWLQANLGHKNLIILDCTIPKINDISLASNAKKQIKGAIFFDIKNKFSDKRSSFPNTVLSAEEFEKKTQELGINNDSVIICYDDLGIYSSPRVWWMFQLMGFSNIAVLDGGFPAWKKQDFPVEIPKKHQIKKGDFKAIYQPKKIKNTAAVLSATKNDKILIIDARSKGRFLGLEPEPRSNVKSGHIPASVNLPYGEIQEKGTMKSSEKIKEIFHKIIKNKEELIFSCGSGITASILAFGAELSGLKNYAVYDGSWTEWGSSNNLPIEI